MNRQSGFTLIEVLVALAIVGLALGGVFSSISMGTRATTEAAAERRVTREAQSFFDQLGREIPVKDGTTEGDWAGGLHWSLAVAPLPDQPDARNRVISGHLATLTVAWTEKGGPRRIEFHTLVLGPAL